MGSNISIWTDAWVPSQKDYKIHNNNNGQSPIKVSEFIEPFLRQWKEDLITRISFVEEAAKVLCIPLSRHLHEDRLVWRGEPMGEYFVRSEYKMLSYREKFRLQIGELSTIFSQPTTICITERINNSAACPRCTDGFKTLEHAFCDCTFVNEIWKELNINWDQETSNDDYRNWISKIYHKSSRAQSRVVTYAIWAIWIDRSKIVHDGGHQSSSREANFIRLYVRDIEVINEKLPGRQIVSERWRPLEPPGSRLILTWLIFPNQTNLVQGFSEVIVDRDNLTVIKKIHVQEIDRSVLSAYIIDAKKTSEDFSGCMFRHVTRNKNELAHILATKGL
ncbi:hypothetical protein Gotri_012608 [Gossypium trilobum]|uniref:RNase H type-1 domain-containing protein n=1 Tax=Gossypium trilobum TaxID=34281 RepID=A0A7J9DQQ2_9ROSI|nr:hypothetical protein [Gossypium trilobum]